MMSLLKAALLDIILATLPAHVTIMHTFPLDFHAIPNVSPIPRGMVALIGGITAEKPIFALRKDNLEIYIYTDGKVPGHLREVIDPDDPFYCYKTLLANRKVYAYYLEVIQQEGLQLQIDFGKTKNVYLFQKGSGFCVHQRDPPAYSLRCPTWATLIREDEIEFTTWGGISDRRGVWREKSLKVDIIYAWSDVEFKFLDAAMLGYSAVRDLDVTFEVYGHLTDINGRVIGLVTEAAWGRMVKFSDKSLVLTTIAKLQKNGFIYEGCLQNRFIISRKKVRLLDPSCIRIYRNQTKFEQAAQKSHWEEINQLFDELYQNGPFGNDRLLPARFTATPKDIIFLPALPSPEYRIFDVLTIYEIFAHTFGNTSQIHFEDDDKPYHPQFLQSGRHLPGRRPIRRIIQLRGNSNSPRSLCPQDIMDKMRQIPSTSFHHCPSKDRILLLSHHPYERSVCSTRASKFTIARSMASPDESSMKFAPMPSN